MQHHFDASIATAYSVNQAIFLDNLAFWTRHNKANKKNFFEGRYWTYNSMDAFLELFPYWTLNTLRKIRSKCVDNDLIIKSNFNKTKYDQTTWYSLTDKAMKLFNIELIDINEYSNPSEPNPGLICAKAQMDLRKSTDLYQI